jgi:hypothetical protein
LTSLRFRPPFFFLTVFGEGVGESSWLSQGGIDAVDVSAKTSTAEEASLWLCNEAILLSMQFVVSKGCRWEMLGATESTLL